MKNVLFQADESLYKQFQLICKIEDVRYGEKLSELMKNYVKNNETKISNPEIQESLPPTQPDFFADPQEWWKFIIKTDRETFKKYDIRVFLLHELMQRRLSTRRDNEEVLTDTVSYDQKLFDSTDDGKYLKSMTIVKLSRDELDETYHLK